MADSDTDQPSPETHSLTHKFSINGHEGFVHVSFIDKERLTKISIRFAKEGSTVCGLIEGFASAVNVCLAHGVPLRELCETFKGTRFEPSGLTGNPKIPRAKSVVDYLFLWLERVFLAPAEPAA